MYLKTLFFCLCNVLSITQDQIGETDEDKEGRAKQKENPRQIMSSFAPGTILVLPLIWVLEAWIP